MYNMRFSIIFVFASLTLAGFAAPNAKRTVAQIEMDLTTITDQAEALSTTTSEFSGSLVEVLTIHADIVNLGSAIDSSTNDVKGTSLPIAEFDGQVILATLLMFQPRIQFALFELGNESAAFKAITEVGRVPTLILQDLQNLQKSADAFLSALTTTEPADLQAQVVNIHNAIDAAFTTAIAAYS
ncbi:hydrophobic surface binding protein A-domain-containing protein [Infundibulicybe gibba]|nr:hydrophobic surface binding protein A-domain-containing protein [Infundibulicybe gibba]